MSQLPFTRRQALAAALALAAVLVVAGRFVVHSEARPQTPPAETVVAEAPAPAEPPQLVVHVVGAVRRPGLYRLDEGSRVADAVALAGGAGPKADLAAVNLAAPVTDGTQVLVPRRGQGATAGTGVASPGSAAASPPGPVRLNTATLEQLDTLPGIGPVTAQRILQYREAYGPFSSVDELDAVPGIGPARLEQLRELVAP
jgi:competence protein ComEA